jgi:TRAP-type mannitol/chloroaromatic compound transport system permease large subunit
MKLLLIVSALVEAAVGASLLILPAFTASTLLGAPLDAPTGLVAARVAGAGLISLAIACWNARNGERHGLAEGMVVALLFYNFAAVAVLVYAGIRLELSSPLLWPTILLHFALGVWCSLNVWFAKRRSIDA